MPNAAIPPARGSVATVPSAGASVPAPAGSKSVTVTTDSAEAGRRVHQAAIRRVLNEGGPQIVYQPQLSLSRLIVDGYEALARFPETPIRGTEQWFSRARELGMGPALEASALERALERRDERPEGSMLAVNLSPAVLNSPAVAAVLPDDLTGIEIELTEHEWVPGAGRLRRQLDLLRERGARVAIDDVGVAHSGLRRVMELAPDRIKLDRHLVVGVSTSTAKSALIRAVVDFAEHIGAGVCAEGVENIDDLEALADLDVGYAQGWVVGLPEPDFRPAGPVAIAAGRDRLNAMLTGRRSSSWIRKSAAATHNSTVGDSTTHNSTTRKSTTRKSTTRQSTTHDSTTHDSTAHDSTADVDELLTRLGTVTGLDQLGALIGTCAGVLGADSLLISVLNNDGTSIQTVTGPTLLGLTATGPGQVVALADRPLVRHCLQSRAVTPVYLDGGDDRPGAGAEAEARLLALTGCGAGLLVPVVSRDRVLGLLECYRKGSAPWTRRQIRSARTIAAMLGPVLDVTLLLR